MIKNDVISSQRDNIKKIDISKSPEKSGLFLYQKLKNRPIGQNVLIETAFSP